jgi:Concanavalin A-like lectin/glucanases superfamily
VRCGWLATIGLCLGLLAGCPRLPAYACLDDTSCDREGASGRCLEDGACAYPDGACESGWVRSPNAADRPGQCEPAPGAESSGIGVTTSSGGDVTEGGSTGATPTCGSSVAFAVNTAFFGAPEVLEGYPVVVSIASPEIVAAIVAGGTDPWVTDAAGVPLVHELEQLDAVLGTLTLWVKLPAYVLDAAVPLRLRFGAPPPTGEPTAVWTDRYVGVWHMDDALSGIDGDAVRNSATPSEAGRTVGEMQPAQNVPGVLGRGLAFDGADDIVTIDAAFVGALDSYSLSMWIRFEGAADAPGDYFQRLNGDFFYPRCWRLAAGSIYCQYIVDDVVTGLNGGLDEVPGQLRHVAMVRDADTGAHRLFIDGELVSENADPVGATLPDDGYPFELGHGELGTLLGMIDEVRVSQAPLPASWVRADYRTQLEPGLVVTDVGAIEPSPCDSE